MPDLDDQLMQARLTNRRLLLLIAVLSLLAVATSATLGYFRFKDAASASALQCAREVAQPYTEARDAREDATGDEVDLVATSTVQDRATFDIVAYRAALLDASKRRADAKAMLKKLGPQSVRIARECG